MCEIVNKGELENEGDLNTVPDFILIISDVVFNGLLKGKCDGAAGVVNFSGVEKAGAAIAFEGRFRRGRSGPERVFWSDVRRDAS